MIVIERSLADVDAMASLPPALLDDGKDWVGVIVRKPWGHEIEVCREAAASVTRLSIKPGGETSLHCHPGKTAVLVVAEGYCELETLRVIYKLKPGDAVKVEPGAFHRIRTEGGASVVEIETPPGKNNIVRLFDRNGRTGQGYAA